MTQTPTVPAIPAWPGLHTRQVTGDMLWTTLQQPLESDALAVREVGTSSLGRTLRTVTFGDGPIDVLLWSQMHGDEATATRSLADLIGAWARDPDDPVHRRIRQNLRVTLLPLVNPDGAQAGQRETADGIDVNRDAVRLASPEARTLATVRDRLQPAFGFNLHDQNVRRRAGPDGDQVAMALLAPPIDDRGAWDTTRLRAGQLAAGMAQWTQATLPRRVARWTDEYEARAFGEGFQRAGTSTVLVETGALPDDPEKELLRAHLTHLLVATLAGLADGSWQQADPEWYHALPDNHTVDHDLHLTGGTVAVGGREHPADVALLFHDPVARRHPALAELGDLGTATALEYLDCTGSWVSLTPQTERSPGAVAPEDRVVVEIRKDGPQGPIIATY